MTSTTSQIKKGKGIEGLVEGFEGKPEEERQIELASSADMDRVVKQYGVFLGITKADTSVESPSTAGRFDKIRTAQMCVEVLSPEQIASFMFMTHKFSAHLNYLTQTGQYASQLVQNSYDAGNNGFLLNAGENGDIGDLATWLKGEKERPIEVTIIGDYGAYWGHHSENCILHIRGNAGFSCGKTSVNLIVEIDGNAGPSCGWFTKGSIFTINGDVGESCGFGSKKSTFKTPNRETLKTMFKEVPEDNRVVFIHPDGTEEIVREYNEPYS